VFVTLAGIFLPACGASEIDEAGTPPPDLGSELVGYRASLYPTPFPTERKNLNGTHTLLGAGLPREVTTDDLVVETIDMPYPVFLYTREGHEIFVLGGTPLGIERYVELIDGLPAGENETAPYLARLDTRSGQITYLDLDRGDAVPYVGGALMHENGFVYVVSQAHLYKVDAASLEVVVSVDLPAPTPATVYNGLATGRTGELILKSLSFASGDTALSLVDPDTLNVVFSTPCDCASPRLTLAVDAAGVEHLYHLNREQTFRYIVEAGQLTLDTSWVSRFDPDGTGVNQEPTSPVVFDGRVFYTTNTNADATLPMRVFWQEVESTYSPDGPPLIGPLLFEDPDAGAGWSFAGLAADETAGIFFAVDQARGLANAFRPTADGDIELLWQRELRVSASNTLVADRGLVYLTDFVDGSNHLVVLDLVTGEERVRLPTPSTRATIGSLLCTPADEVWMASNEPGRPTGHLVRVRVRD
jgi:outer membrane protein assembly factor BamB